MVDADIAIDDVDLEKFDSEDFPQTVTASDKINYDESGIWINLLLGAHPTLRMGNVA